MAVVTDGLRKLPRPGLPDVDDPLRHGHLGGLLEDLEAGKVMSMPSAGTTVAITVEPAGGSTSPRASPSSRSTPSRSDRRTFQPRGVLLERGGGQRSRSESSTAWAAL